MYKLILTPLKAEKNLQRNVRETLKFRDEAEAVVITHYDL